MDLTPQTARASNCWTTRKTEVFPVSGAPGEADKIPDEEVTPEMIEAGQRCLDELFDATVEAGADAGLMCIPGGWAEAVFRAMSNKRNRPPAVSFPRDSS
jgi:hypothetical protein